MLSVCGGIIILVCVYSVIHSFCKHLTFQKLGFVVIMLLISIFLMYFLDPKLMVNSIKFIFAPLFKTIST